MRVFDWGNLMFDSQIRKFFFCEQFPGKFHQLFAVSNKDNNIMIFDLGVGWPSKELKNCHNNEINCVQFSPNEKLVASFSLLDKKIVIWRVNQ